MPPTPCCDSRLQEWISRIRTGDLAARDELLRGVCGPLERLARKMLKQNPRVHRWADTDDVLQNALLRLFRALHAVQPESPRAFFGLAAEQIRRELLDMARHFYGPNGVGANHASKGDGEAGALAAHDYPDAAQDLKEIEKWTAFHEEVANLPAMEREVVGLTYYQGWKQPQVAELFQVSVRTVQRRWESAMTILHQRIKERCDV